MSTEMTLSALQINFNIITQARTPRSDMHPAIDHQPEAQIYLATVKYLSFKN